MVQHWALALCCWRQAPNLAQMRWGGEGGLENTQLVRVSRVCWCCALSAFGWAGGRGGVRVECIWVRERRTYLLLVQLEGGLDQVPQGCELLLLLVLSLFDLRMGQRQRRGDEHPVDSARGTWTWRHDLNSHRSSIWRHVCVCATTNTLSLQATLQIT